MMDLRREFNGINAILETRHDDRLSLELRYSWSTTRGSIDTTLDESSGFSRIYDDPNERINSDGYLGSDIRHTLRMVAVYKAPYDISAAIYLRYESGAPLDRLLLNPDMGRYEIRGDERGSVYRKQAVSTIDLRLEKRIDLAGNHNLTVILDIFNLADDDAPVSYLVNDVEIGRPLQLREPRRFRWGLRYSF
jgi:hypothetical protein